MHKVHAEAPGRANGRERRRAGTVGKWSMAKVKDEFRLSGRRHR